jgi:hypothetical protein
MIAHMRAAKSPDSFIAHASADEECFYPVIGFTLEIHHQAPLFEGEMQQ